MPSYVETLNDSVKPKVRQLDSNDANAIEKNYRRTQAEWLNHPMTKLFLAELHRSEIKLYNFAGELAQKEETQQKSNAALTKALTLNKIIDHARKTNNNPTEFNA